MEKNQKPRKSIPVALIVIVVVAVAAWLLWKRCGGGFGLGGGDGKGGGRETAGEMTAPPPGDAMGGAAARCQLRVDAKGVFHDGKQVEVEAAVKACGQAKTVELNVTGDALHGQIEALEAAVRKAGAIPVRRQGTVPE
jgi:hypothetical protein